ncbi:hypothetical protein I309_06004 [Cryptococcus deuterogattii LA55]|nr:hypothetical protein I309_06004 [Cryptococcus deuterogattii LA55]KIR89720.1 hypothetical protein I304_06438 [Cryptococcus deuterogattii CBS 10090]
MHKRQAPILTETGTSVIYSIFIGVVRSNHTRVAIAVIAASGSKVLDRQRINYFPASVFDHSLGGLDFTNWVVELAKQEQELSVFFHIVIVCSVTDSFHAGIIVGTVAEGRKRKI